MDETAKATTEVAQGIASALDYTEPTLSTDRKEAQLDENWGTLPFSRWKNVGRTWYIPLTDIATSATLGDSFHSVTVPKSLDGAKLIDVEAAVTTAAAASGPILIQLNNGADMLITRVSITDTKKTSTASGTTQPVVDQSNAVLRAGVQIDIDIDDIADSGAFGWQLFLYLQ